MATAANANTPEDPNNPLASHRQPEFVPPRPDADLLIHAIDLHTYYGASHILRGVNFQVRRGETIGLMGRNGMGKSTLLKSIMGLVKPRGGGVLVSFRISTQSWPEETLLSVVMENGQPYPPGAIAYAEGMGREMSTVVNTRGQVWVGELLPARSFVIRHAGTTCEFNIPPIGPDTVLAPVRPSRCSRPA